MSYATVNGFKAFDATLSVPRVGNWHADILVDAQSLGDLSGPVTLSLGDDQVIYQGVTLRTGLFADYVTMRVIGGTGGLQATTLTPKSYQAVPLRLVLQDILNAAGETLSPSSDQGLLATQLTAWASLRQSAGAALFSLLKVIPTSSWRFLPDGTVWVGYESWPVVDSQIDYVLLSSSSQRARIELAAEIPNLFPGTNFRGHNISYVTHYFEPSAVRTVAYFES